MTRILGKLSDTQKLDWLRLIRSENVGPRTFRRLLDLYGDPGRALAALPDLARQGGKKRPIVLCSPSQAAQELARGEQAGMTLVAECEALYPALLARIEDAPPVLWAKGDLSLLSKPMIGVVGARNASVNGRTLTRQLVQDLGRAGLAVVSGLARGIDAAAHGGSLTHGTIAVMAGGLDVVYPPENQALYDQIVAAGLVVAELPPGTQPQSGHFPRRNRIVSGLSLGVLVVEASLRSGSLITARMALEQNREIFAVPGFPMDPRAQGPNDLIRQGATLTERAQDVLDVLAPLLEHPLAEGESPPLAAPPPPPPGDAELAQARPAIVELLGYAPVTVDEILRQCQLSPALVSLVLLELELAGRLERLSGHRVCLLSD